MRTAAPSARDPQDGGGRCPSVRDRERERETTWDTGTPHGDQSAATRRGPLSVGTISAMEALKRLSNEQLAARLSACAIPHGPVVASTRCLYEKKLLETLRPGHRPQVRGQRSPAGIAESEEEDDNNSEGIYSTFSSPSQSAARHRQDRADRRRETRSAPLGNTGPGDNRVPVWLKLLLFALVAGLLLYVYWELQWEQDTPVRSIEADSV
uniref:uncharacterized protein isoform X2 n=1 Tax=Pristiophorus japonicus TaxID=55135 RepID=UPI00398F7041